MLITSIPSIALAQDDKAPAQRGALLARVAAILNIDQQKLEDAFKQSLKELRTEALNSGLNKLVSEGTLTQAQANEIKAWLEAKPDIPLVRPRQFKKLLDEGVITQEQANQLKAWLQSRPDIPGIGPKILEAVKSQTGDQREALAARVAQILGINQQKLEDALKQATGELREKALDTRLEELVNESAWTQQQADAFKAWLKARPDVPPLRPARSPKL
jgi:Asp-tRNA(Asn)/Glu-tRNA(Gln) amidotransferase B subunit